VNLLVEVAVFVLLVGRILAGFVVWSGDVYDVNTSEDRACVPTAVTGNPLSIHEPVIEQAKVFSRAKVWRRIKEILATSISLSVQPVKIIAGYFQIAIHAQDVLHTELPRHIADLLQKFRFLAVNIDGIFALKCYGIGTFHGVWLLEVIFVPSVMFAAVTLCWLRRRKTQGDATAKAKLIDELFLVLFIVYPFVTNKLFSILNCRVLSADLTVLAADYSVDCDGESNDAHQTLSIVLIVFVSLGVPICLLLFLRREHRKRLCSMRAARMTCICRHVMMELDITDVHQVQTVLIDLELGSQFGRYVLAPCCFTVVRLLIQMRCRGDTVLSTPSNPASSFSKCLICSKS